MKGLFLGVLAFGCLASAAAAQTVKMAREAPSYAQQVKRVEAAQDHPDVGPVMRLSKVTAYRNLHNGVEVFSGRAAMHITAIESGILRIQISPDSDVAPHHSWAVLPAMQGSSVPVTPLQNPVRSGAIGFSTAKLHVVIERDPLRLEIEDAAGKILSEDYANRSVTFHGQSFEIYKSSPLDEHYYGLGDKPGALDRRNRAFTLWNIDAYGWQESTDPLYKSIPFFLALRNGVSYGIFLDDTWCSNFDFDKQLRDGISFGAEGGDLDYYFLYGPSPKQVVESYTALTGRIPLPSLWTLGFQQSRYSYTPESRVLQVAGKFRQLQIPIDAIYLDIGYQYKNRPFTIDTKTFPTFKKMVQELADEQIHVVAIADLHIAKAPNQGYAPYDSGIAGNEFVHNPDGSVYVGNVWPGPSVFPDFTRKATRDWFGNLYRDFYLDKGISGFWDDMNEPSIFDVPTKTMPLNVIHRIAGPNHPFRLATHREVHNVYGMQNSRATYEGMLRLKPDQRAFVLTRASYAGGQRYAATWTGDNSSTWNHLRISVPQLLNLGVSGFAMVGDDIGGYKGSPVPDLLTRWIELGSFNPIDRDHTEIGSADQEPWADGPQQEPIRKHYIEVRYQLMPYIYTVAEESSRDGLPIMRPMYLEFPVGMEDEESEFMFGPSLLVASQPERTMGNYVVSFPKNIGWYDYWTGLKVDPSQPTVIHPKLDLLPVYVRAGSIIPQQPVVENTAAIPNGPLKLRIYPGPNCRGSLYVDDGKSFAYRRGEFMRESFTCTLTANGIDTQIARRGTYRTWWKHIELIVYGAARAARSIQIDGSSVNDAQFDANARAVQFTVGTPKGNSVIHVVY
ncbi:MAG: glycoside hydrolase family 31 protein [Acidobacteriaceae bacterium]